MTNVRSAYSCCGNSIDQKRRLWLSFGASSTSFGSSLGYELAGTSLRARLQSQGKLEIQGLCESVIGVVSMLFLLAALLIFAPLNLVSQAPTPSASPESGNKTKTPDLNDSADIAEKLTNPLASLISVPLQNWFDFNLGPKKDGFRYTMEAQPVLPLHISENWDLISRATIPVIYQDNVINRTNQTGLGDSTLSFFLSPVRTKSFVWGIGPDVLIPTGTNGVLSGRKLGFGPTAIAIRRKNHTVMGLLASEVWSVAGSQSHSYVSETYTQPFAAYTTRTALTFATNSYDTYDWNQGRWTVIVNPLRVSKVVKLGSQRLSFGGTPRCVVTSPQYQPKGCGLEFTVTPVFPAK